MHNLNDILSGDLLTFSLLLPYYITKVQKNSIPKTFDQFIFKNNFNTEN